MSIMKNHNILRAAVYATVAHSEVGNADGTVGQTRKYDHETKHGPTRLPYIVHPLEVAMTVASVTQDVPTIMAAILHDVVEDTDRTIKDIEREFGGEVARLTAGVTDVSRLSDGNRKKRKEMDRKHLAEGCPRIHTIKLADVICNGNDISAKDPNFSYTYMTEIRELIKVLKTGNKKLLKEANEMVEAYFVKLDATRPQCTYTAS